MERDFPHFMQPMLCKHIRRQYGYRGHCDHKVRIPANVTTHSGERDRCA
jgi:hypothetical protein